ncbi:hypothetical protein [Weissella paramesenteroides]|uniref:hypothetical protein n=1 Tax=Weissella paramesenteroides TaxID=1249 RepID=UPI00376EC701
MKKIMFQLDDLAPVFLMIGYFSLTIGAWEFMSHLVTQTLSFEEIGCKLIPETTFKRAYNE